jgi:hypothetical protein
LLSILLSLVGAAAAIQEVVALADLEPEPGFQ